MQNMRHMSKLTWILEEGKYNTLFKAGPPTEERQKLQLVTQAFAKVVQFLWKCKKGQSVKPGEFWTNVNPAVFDTQYEQLAQKTFHDAHEFCQFLIETIHKSTIQDVDMRITYESATSPKDVLIQSALTEWKKYFANEYSPLVHLFYGLFHYKTTCQGCNNVSHRWEPFNSLKIPVKAGETVDLIQALRDDLLHEEIVEEYQCDSCGPPRKQAKRTVSIWKLPPALILCAKRFDNQSKKISVPAAPVSLQPIDFTPFFSEESPERDGAVHYTLRGIVDHHGSGLQGGHYTAQCRHVDTGQWFMYDDEHVHSVEKPMFGASTYMLFLERA
jgi:ubiquitin C-terminal hydrolase